MEIANIKLNQNLFVDCRQLLENNKQILDSITGADSLVQATYYKFALEFNRKYGPPSDFYKHALLYLAFTPLQSIPDQDKVKLAFDLGTTALIGESIYNFGELLLHPIIQTLKNTEHEWLSQILYAFNSGKIKEYTTLITKYRTKLEQYPAFVANAHLLVEKVHILCLMELIFHRPSDNRTITFTDIGHETQLPIDEVEILLMKAMSLDLIRGSIDQIDQTVTVTWVQPRILNLDQIQTIRDKTKQWVGSVYSTLRVMETETPELLV